MELEQDLSVSVITIDGGSITGKGTVRRLVARALGFNMLDSGVLYRAVAQKAAEEETKTDDIDKLVCIAQNLDVRFEPSINFTDETIFLNGVDCTEKIRSRPIAQLASQISSNERVRNALRHLQLNARKLPGLVADGRDQGFIFQTPHRFFLYASPEIKAMRQAVQFGVAAESDEYKQILSEISERDQRDETRPVSPLRPYPTARCIYTDYLSPQGVADIILRDYRASF